MGDVTEMFPSVPSASGSPTICHTFFAPAAGEAAVGDELILLERKPDPMFHDGALDRLARASA